MTVQELVTILRNQDPHSEVFCIERGRTLGAKPITEVRKMIVTTARDYVEIEYNNV